MADRTKFLKLARDRWKQGEEANLKQVQREIEDLRFYAGEQWDADIMKSRKGQTIGSGSTAQVVPARPCLTINKTREPVRQVLNQERQSDMGVELIPADDFGEMTGPIDHTEIELREGLVRRIQRDSEASDARTWAFSRSAIAGRGYWGVMTRFVPGTFDQEVFIHRFYNQNSVNLDPTHEQPDASDIEWGFVGTDVPWMRYKSEFSTRNGKKNRLTNEISDQEWRTLGNEAPNWFTGEGDLRSVRVVDYWFTERTSVTLYQLSNGKAAKKADLEILPPGVTLVLDPDTQQPMTRTDVQKQIKWAKIDGCDDDVLEETDWPGHYIPIIKVIGEELQPYDQERRCEGIVRPMRDPCEANNYLLTKFVEQIGLTPIPPWNGPAGFDEGFEAEYDAANTRTLGRLHYNPFDASGRPIDPPTRTNVSTDVSSLAAGVQIFGQAIAATSVVPETALGNVDPSVKSGKLAKALIEQANRGTSNFLDNLVRSMRHEARIVNDLLYPIYGARPGRLARLMNAEGEMSSVLVGQPFMTQGEGPQARPQPLQLQPGQPPPEGAKTYKLTPDAEFNVAIKVSKNYDTRREQEAAILGDIISASPEQMGVVGDLFFKYQDGPGHEEMSERYKAVLVPPVQALVSGQPKIPPQLQAQMQQMQQQMQELQQLADKNKTDLAKTQMDNQTKLQIAQQEQAGKERLAWISASAALATAGMKVDAENARSFVDALEAKGAGALEAHMTHLAQAHEGATMALDHAHEAHQASLDRQHEAEMAAQTHQQGLETIAAQPQPTNGASA